MSATPERVAIVGGGMLGMVLARRLAQAGRAVTLIEAAPALGGLAGAWSLPDGDAGEVVWDRHYHVTLSSDAHLHQVLRELDLASELRFAPTRTGAYADGRLYSVSSTSELLRFPPLSLLSKLRLGATVLYASRLRDGRPLEAVRVEEWLVRLSGRPAFERFWKPLLRSKLGEAWRETSAAFMWATLRRLYAARSSGRKQEQLGYVRGGYARVLERMGRVLREQGVRVQLDCPVKAVAPAEGGVSVEYGRGGAERFDRGIVTLAAPLAARLCRGLSPDETARLAGVRYLGIVCASLLLDRPLADFYVTNLLDDGLPFTGVIELTALVPPRELGGRHLVYLPRYVTAEDPFYAQPDAAVEQGFTSALARMYPAFRPAHVRAFRVSRVRHVFALPTLGYSDRLPPVETSVPGLYLLSSAHIVNGTLNVNETVQLAEQALPQLTAPLRGSDSGSAPAR